MTRVLVILMVPADLNILRMIKLFAWQGYTLDQIAKARAEELALSKRVRLMEAYMFFSNETIPMLAKLVVFAVYVGFFVLL